MTAANRQELRPWCECDPEYEGRCPDPCALDTIGKSDAASVPEPLGAAELRDAIGDILDICQGWTRPMTDEQKLEAILSVATKAWEDDRD